MVVVENLISSETCGEIKHNYSYRMIKSKIVLNSGRDTMEVQSYGIEVERQDFQNGSLINIERECIKSISPHRHKVHNLLKMLFDYAVSPIHLYDILGEYVDEYIVDFDEALKCTAVH
jgi:hydroxymethylpyrimidine pyrophosphatase-like HAD family hydrolase